MLVLKTLITTLLCCYATECMKKFEPTWESLDKHVAPSWYDEGKIGIFMHWGLYSVPGFGVPGAGGEWFWERWRRTKDERAVKFMKDNYAPNFHYQDFAPMFKAEFFNPDEWADLIEESGAKYFVITSKHHEGFTMWQSNVSWNWNAVDCGPHRDIIGELERSVRNRTKVHFGIYYSLFEWFHPLYALDSQNNFKTNDYVKYVAKPQMYDYVNRYKPEYIWSDGSAGGGSDYWQSKEFIAWLYNDSPVRDNILVNDRWGPRAVCKHGDVKNCADRFLPDKKLAFKWENAMTLDKKSWGNRRNTKIEDYMTIQELLYQLASTVSLGGNILINVGPTHDGRIEAIFQERLKQLGSWLKVNGKAIYSTKMWREQNDTVSHKVWFTQNADKIFAIVLEIPTNGLITLHSPIPSSSQAEILMLGYDHPLKFTAKPGKPGVQIDVSQVKPLPCAWAWSFVLTGFK